MPARLSLHRAALLLCLGLLAPVTAGAAALTVGTGTSQTLTAGTYSYSDVLVQNGGTLYITGAVQINAATFTVEAGGLVDGNGRGYAGAPGDGNYSTVRPQNKKGGPRRTALFLPPHSFYLEPTTHPSTKRHPHHPT